MTSWTMTENIRMTIDKAMISAMGKLKVKNLELKVLVFLRSKNLSFELCTLNFELDYGILSNLGVKKHGYLYTL